MGYISLLFVIDIFGQELGTLIVIDFVIGVGE